MKLAFRTRFLALCSLAVLLGMAAATTPLNAQWTPVWGDEFNGSAGSSYDTSKWRPQVTNNTGNSFGDGTIMSTTDSRANSYQDGNGNLIVAMTYDSATGKYYSARLTSLPPTGPYGKIETRLITPSALGMGAAFWALGADYATGTPWPWAGELDMMETQARTPGHNGSTIHGGETDSQTSYEYGGVSVPVDLPSGQTFNSTYHTFTTQWSPYRVQYFLDGVQYGDVNLATIGATDIWPLEQGLNLILSTGVGGNGGTPNGVGFPSNMTVDYVRYARWTAGAPSPVTGLTTTATASNAAVLNWTASATAGVTYNVYASTTAGYTPGLNTLVAQNVTGTSYTVGALNPNTTYSFTVRASNYGGESAVANGTATTYAPGRSTQILLSAGGYAIGNYMGSQFVLGGNTNFHRNTNVDTSAVANPAPQGVYDTERWGPAAWTITGLNPGGTYNVRLHFVEFAHAANGARAFNVTVNGAQVLTNFDIYAIAGATNKAIVQQYLARADENGIIEVQTTLGTSTAADLNPSLNAIDLLPAPGNNPVAIAAGNNASLQMNSGSATAVGSFAADQFFNLGVTAASTAAVSTANAVNPAPASVYQSQRYVPFTYALSGLVANGTYNLRMHFAETYWTAAGKRVFNVVVNGKQVLTALDPFAVAGLNNAIVKEFPTNANGNGQIFVQFVYAGADQPEISGIEAILLSSAVAAPTGFTASATSSQVNLTWSASSTAGVAYNVYRGAAGSTPVSIAGVNGTSYTDTGASNTGNFVYYVVATQGAGFSPASNWATVTAGSGGNTCTTVPTIPGTPSASAASASQVNLTWGASTSSCTGITYKVFRGTTSGFAASASNQIASGQTGTSFADTGLAASTAYFYLVQSSDAAGSSASSAQATATTQAGTCTTNCGTAISINAGGPASGVFVADTDFAGGGTAATGNTVSTAGVTNAAPAAVYQSERAGTFTYTLPGFVKGSTHTVRLHFAETYFTAVGKRIFNVAINGTPVLTNFDIFATVGANKALVEQFTATADPTTGNIVINFSNGSIDQPKVDGVEVQ